MALAEADMLFNKELSGALKDIVVGGCPYFGDI
jgi:hypothetical protein